MANLVYMAKSAWTGLLDSIRAKAGTAASMTVSEATTAVQNIPTGGNIITGSFTTNAEGGAAQTVNIDYSGNGYPVAIVIWVKGGIETQVVPINVAYNSVLMCAYTKSNSDTTPNYTGSLSDEGARTLLYKNSKSTASNVQGSGGRSVVLYKNESAETSASTMFRIMSNNRLSVNVNERSQTGFSYGLMSGIEYEYMILYSE